MTAWRWRSSTTVPPTSRDRWAVPDQPADDALRAVVAQIASTGTRRAGRLLAPYGIRSIVVPVVDGASSTATAPLPIPDGLIDALGAQLDLARGRTPPTLIRFDNTAYIPTTASLTGDLAAASTATDAEAVVGVETAGGVPVFVDVDRTRDASGDVPAGTVHLATPLDGGWELTVGGAEVAARASFGAVTAFDAPTAGSGVLRYAQPSSRSLWLIVQGVLWVLTVLAASRLTVPARLRPRRTA